MTTLERLVDRRSQARPKLMRRLQQRNGLIQQPVEAMAGPWIRVNGHWLLNFASTNYLGLNHHPYVLRAISSAIDAWGTSLSMPRLLATDRLTARLETEFANLVKQDKALVFPSTTHIALDLLPLLAGPKGALFIDAWAYPISLEGARAARQHGAQIHHFPHNDCYSLMKLLRTQAHLREKVIVCDGVYSAGGHPAPLDQLARIARDFDAIIYVDDAHGIGVLGERPSQEMPYGYGGGGTPNYFGVKPGNIVHVGSLSKAFGVPLAFMTGPTSFVDYLRATVPTYTHSSPPAIPVLAAALGALQVHHFHGETLRRGLLNRVRHFREGLRKVGLRLSPDELFPLQTLYFATPQATETAGRRLRRMGFLDSTSVQPAGPPSGRCPTVCLNSQSR